MTSRPIVPCLWFDDQAEQAATFYTESIGGRITARSYYPESSDNPSGRPRGSVLTVELELAGQRLTALNGGPMFTMNPSISFFLHVDRAEEVDPLFARLAEGGEVMMPLGTYPWSKRYGWVTDRFGASWQVISGRRPPDGATIEPVLMFAGPQHGRAEEAMRTYVEIFPGSRVESVERYTAEEGAEGTVKLGRFALSGQFFSALDSHIAHGITFNEALSLQVMCDDQATVDRYWARLSEQGQPGPCGWLQDRFGVSWQVVPSGIERWLTSDDAAARERAFSAMMAMGKPDIAALSAAFEGRGREPRD